MLENDEWFKKIENSLTTVEYINEYKLPLFPSDQIQLNTTGMSGKQTLEEAYFFYENCVHKFSQSILWKNENKKLLDFGTGWGRILRFFLKDIKGDNLHGVEVDQSLLNICANTFQWGHFIKNNPLPPIDIPNESIDFIVGYSVFSHLSEDACLLWMKEFHRILKPGGMIALTTRGEWFIDYCENLQKTSTTGYQNALANVFDNYRKAKETYKNGDFLHANTDGVSGGGPLDKSFYGESFIPESYAQRVYSKFFRVYNFEFYPDGSGHPTMFFKKEI